MRNYIKRVFAVLIVATIIATGIVKNIGIVKAASSLDISETDTKITLTWKDNPKYFYVPHRIIYDSDGKIVDDQIINSSGEPQINRLRVLQVYPTKRGGYTQLKNWMEDAGWAASIFNVDTVWLDTQFNANPMAYLKSSNAWKYDVLYIGGCDTIANIGLTNDSYEAIREFILAGKGCILAHDTASRASAAYDVYDSYYNRLASEFFNIEFNNAYLSSPVRDNYSDSVHVVNDGYLLTYPYSLSSISTDFTIPETHNTGQVAHGTIWFSFNVSDWKRATNGWDGAGSNFYLTTNSNCAMIQTGHSNGGSNSAEKMILTNLIYYCGQARGRLVDTKPIDDEAPDRPNVKIVANDTSSVQVSVNSKEEGVTYQYVIQEAKVNSATNSGVLVQNIETPKKTVESGIKGYYYWIDGDKKSKDSDKKLFVEGESVESLSIQMKDGQQYLHIYCVDNAGNESKLKHFDIAAKDSTAPSLSAATEIYSDVVLEGGSQALDIQAVDPEIDGEVCSGLYGYYLSSDENIDGEFVDSIDKLDVASLRSGTAYLWAIDNAGNISEPHEIKVHSDLYYNGNEINQVYFKGKNNTDYIEMTDYYFKDSKVFF